MSTSRTLSDDDFQVVHHDALDVVMLGVEPDVAVFVDFGFHGMNADLSGRLCFGRVEQDGFGVVGVEAFHRSVRFDELIECFLEFVDTVQVACFHILPPAV